MALSQNNKLINRFISFSKFSSLLVILIGTFGLIGWIFDIPELRSIFPGFETMKVNTALGLILIGITLQLNLQEKQRFEYVKHIGGFVILLLGLLTLIQYIFSINLGIDQLIFADLYAAPGTFPGRMSFASALSFSLMGLALLFLNNEKEKIRELRQIPAVIVITISFLALIGYIYDVQALYKLDAFSSTAVHTAIAFTLGALAVLWISPDEGWTKTLVSELAGGIVLRRLLPSLLGMPLILGWLILLGARADLYDTNFGFAIISVLIAGYLVIILLRNSKQLNLVDQSREQTQEKYITVLDNLIEGAHIIGFDWRYIYVNENGAKHGRQEQKTLMGKTMMEAYPGIENLSLFPALRNCMNLREVSWVEAEFFYPDGSSGWFEFSVQPIPEGIFILTIEITARKQAEKAFQKLNMELEGRIQARTLDLKTANEQLQNELVVRKQIETDLRQSETRYRALFEQSNDAVFILDFQGNHITVNHHAAEMLGYTVEEIQHLSYADLSAETEKSEKVLSRLLAGERVPFFERLFLKKSGEVFPVEINVELVRDDSGTPLHIQSVVRDITKRKKNEETTNRQNKMLSDLHNITLDLLKQEDLEKLLERIVELSAEFLEAEHGEIMFLENENLVVQAATQKSRHLLGERVGRNDAIISWQAFETHQPVILSDYSQWEHRRKVYSQTPLFAVADFPILSNEKCIGVLAFGRSQPNYEFAEEQIQFGKLFASMTALVLNNAQLRETLREQSTHDSLTGLFNRRYMEETLKQEISRAVRNNHSLGIIMLDIDHFKNFNDSLGHIAGDSLLRQLGQFLQKNVRIEDVACRYGGEEFILILPNTDLEIAKQRAEQLCLDVKHLKAENANSGVTVSFGVAIYPQHGKTINKVIHAADMALYQAKQNGRNRVEVATEISN